MHEHHGGLGVRQNDNLGRNFSFVGHCLVFVFGWAHCGSIMGGFVLALTVCEFSAIFITIIDCFPMMIHWISKEASTRA